MNTRSAQVADVQVVMRGNLSNELAAYARNKIVALAEHFADPVLHARIRLTHQPDPAVTRPVRVQVNLDVRGRLVRAQAAGIAGEDAVDMVVDRLRRRLTRGKRHWEARRGSQPDAAAHEWRHSSEPTERPPYYPRPVDERQVVRHRSFTPAPMSPGEAALEMDGMDYGFYLFTDAATGEDAVVYRDGSPGYRIARLSSGPLLTCAGARERLEAAGLPFVFFADTGSGRGNVLYHRYDGHYGLITPAR